MTIGDDAVQPLSGAIRKVLFSPFVAIIATAGLIALTTWIIVFLRRFSGDDRPYAIIYLLPVAIGGALLGLRGAILAWFTTLLFARLFLFNGIHILSTGLPGNSDLSNHIEFAALAIGTLVVGVVTGRLRSALEMLHSANVKMAASNSSLAELNQRIVESELQRRAFNRDVLRAVTNGKLLLVEPEELDDQDFPGTNPTYEQRLIIPKDASNLRQSLQRQAECCEIDPSRILDLCTSVTEAATNAINHGSGGIAQAWVTSESVVVLIRDYGEGIPHANIARATLEKGYSTRVSLGMGFFLILDTVDSVVLSTSNEGTTLVITILNKARAGEGDTLLARYAAAQV